MSMYAFTRTYVRVYTQTHIQTEINIILSVLYVIPEQDVPVREYAIDRNVKSRDWPFPKWNIFICLWSCIITFHMNMYAYTREYIRVYTQTHI